MLSKTVKTLTALLLLLLAATVCSAGDTIRVGYVNVMNYSHETRDGSLSGYEVEYLHAVAQHTDWEYKFTEVENVEEGLELLRQNKIDIMGGIKPSTARRREFVFSKNSCALDKSALIVMDTDTRYSYEAYQTFNGMKVGYLDREKERVLELLSFAHSKGFSIETEGFADSESLFHSLHNGAVDAVTVSALYNLSTNYRVVLRSDFIPLYFAVNKRNAELIKMLDAAVTEILQVDPYFNINLYTKHYASDTVKPEFTQEEKEFIEKGREIIIVYDPDFSPIEYMDRETGEFTGYAAKVFEKISEKSGLRFRAVPSEELQENPDFLKESRDYDICSTFSYDYAWAEKHKVRITKPYISKVPAIIISKKGHHEDPLKIEKIALVKNYFYPGKIRERFPEYEPVYYHTTEECLNAVLRGEADFAGASLYDADYYFTTSKKYTELVYRSIPDLFYEYGIGVSRKAEKPLFSIISKTLNSLTEEDNKEIFLTSWNARSENGWYYIKRNSETFTVLILFVISLLAVSIIIEGLFIHRRVIRDLINAKEKRRKN